MNAKEEYTIEELDKIITAYNGSLFDSVKKVPQKSENFVADVDDITLPKFKKYLEDFSNRSKYSKNPLAKAIAEGQSLFEIQELLKQYKATNKILYTDGDGNTLLHLSIATPSHHAYLLELIKQLKQACVSVNQSNKFGMQAFHMALALDKQQILSQLFFRGDVQWHLQKWDRNLAEEQRQIEKSSDSCDFS